MSEMGLFLGGMILVLIVAMLIKYAEMQGECRHSWTGWEWADTEDAFVQLRRCRHCQFTQIHQTPKVKARNDGERT